MGIKYELPLLLIPAWALAIDPFLGACCARLRTPCYPYYACKEPLFNRYAPQQTYHSIA